MSTFLSGQPADIQHSYLRDRVPGRPGPPTTQARFVGTRDSLDSIARYEMGTGAQGGMIAATEVIWVDLPSYGGFIDVVPSDVITELDTQLVFTVISVANPSSRRLQLTVMSKRRSGPA